MPRLLPPDAASARGQDYREIKGQQTVSLSEEDGVTVFYGKNMREKTSLLNAIRFAFFGKIIGRGMRPASLHKVGNWERAAEGAEDGSSLHGPLKRLPPSRSIPVKSSKRRSSLRTTSAGRASPVPLSAPTATSAARQIPDPPMDTMSFEVRLGWLGLVETRQSGNRRATEAVDRAARLATKRQKPKETRQRSARSEMQTSPSAGKRRRKPARSALKSGL